MPYVQKTLGLVGHYAGQTVTLQGHRFVNGLLVIHGPEPEVESLARYLGKSYQAYDVNSSQYKEACDGERNHQRTVQEEGESTEGDVQPHGSGTASEAADDSPSDDVSETGGEGSVSVGDGHENTGLHPGSRLAKKIIAAVQSLDPSDDLLWTTTGLPKVTAVEQAAGTGELSRKLIEQVCPGFIRPGV